MCYFITIAVPETDPDSVRSVVPRGFALESVQNASVLASLPPKYQTFLLISGGCSCGLYQGEPVPSSRSHDPAHLRQKYAKKGWSIAKIDRAINQSMAAQSHSRSFLGFRDDVTDILKAIAAKVSKFALLIHWYNGRVDDEQINLGAPQRIKVADLGEFVPEEDRLLWIAGA